MKKTLLATAAGLLLIACGGTPKTTPSISPPPALTPGEQRITSLERACLSDPMDAAKWEALAAALEADGQRERAIRMSDQAATLRAHDVRRDYALLREKAGKAVDTRPPSPDPLAAMPRTEVRQIGAAMVEVLRVAPTATAKAKPSPVAPAVPTAPAQPVPAQPVPALVRLEISNGNGVTGAAARLARSLNMDGLKSVRLTNVKNYDVPLSRIEYQREQQPMAESLSERLGLPLKAQSEKLPGTDMRIVLGHDARGGQFK